MNFALLKATIKGNYKTILIFLLIMLMYLSIIIGMFNPEDMKAFEEMLKMMPTELIKAMGFTMEDSSLIGFIAGYYYGFIIIMFPMIYTIMTSHKMIVKYVDSGSMAYLLSTPNTRRKIALTQAIFLLASTWLLLTLVALIGLVISNSMFPGQLDIGKYLILNLGVLALFGAISGIGFIASCIFNESRHALSLGAGLPIIFFIINMLVDVDVKLSFLKYFTIFSLFKPNDYIKLASIIYYGPISLLIITFGLYYLGIEYFSRKDLPL